MSIASEITRINGNIADAYTALDGKGATLPAAGSQNSANLADTIDTITVGGGSSGERPDYMDDYEAMKAVMESDISNNLSKSNCESLGWILVTDDAYTMYFQGYVIPKLYDTIYFRSDTAKAYKVPSTATVTQVSDTNWYKVSFGSVSNARWICYGNSLSAGFPPETYYGKMFSLVNSSTTDVQCAMPVCFYDSKTVSGITFDTLFGASTNVPNYFLKILDVPNYTSIGNSISAYSDYSRYFSMSKFDNYFDLLPKFKIYSDGYLVVSGDTAVDACGGTFNETHIFYDMYKDVPILLDLSSVTKTGTLTLFSWYRSHYSTHFHRLTKVRIKLPSTYSTVDLRGYSNDGLCLSMENLQYMATNAPTVSSATLKLGNILYYYLDSTETGQAIKSTFTGKGWTLG